MARHSLMVLSASNRLAFSHAILAIESSHEVFVPWLSDLTCPSSASILIRLVTSLDH